ncbi:MAG TPA: hypothetical protein DCS28_01890 [Candidatus Moranbacteria bacterium]|nr:hypothetical protein [Candidatus Moranbacteria bacterium]HAT74771.1 hypothetical protein [Candidatus Moranbacteria bacterium]
MKRCTECDSVLIDGVWKELGDCEWREIMVLDGEQTVQNTFCSFCCRKAFFLNTLFGGVAELLTLEKMFHTLIIEE